MVASCQFWKLLVLETFELLINAIDGNYGQLGTCQNWLCCPNFFEPSKVAKKGYFWLPEIATFGNF